MGAAKEHVLAYAPRRRRWKRWAWVGLMVWLVVYGAGYGWLRSEHHLVRHETYYTGDDGRRVRTDHIQTGEWRGDWRGGWVWEVAYWIWTPARWVESAVWRRMP